MLETTLSSSLPERNQSGWWTIHWTKLIVIKTEWQIRYSVQFKFKFNLHSNRANCAKDRNTFSLPAFWNGIEMLDFSQTFFHLSVMSAIQRKTCSAILIGHLLHNSIEIGRKKHEQKNINKFFSFFIYLISHFKLDSYWFLYNTFCFDACRYNNGHGIWYMISFWLEIILKADWQSWQKHVRKANSLEIPFDWFHCVEQIEIVIIFEAPANNLFNNKRDSIFKWKRKTAALARTNWPF